MWLSGLHIPESYLTAVMQVRVNGCELLDVLLSHISCYYATKIHGVYVCASHYTERIQTACRAKKWPLDKLTLYTSITDQMDGSCIANIPESGCYISRLYLEGASWDAEKRCLCKQRPKVINEFV